MKAAGGILLRSLIPLILVKSSETELIFINVHDKKSLVEGPCNVVNFILKHTKPEEFEGEFDIRDLVKRDDFNLDAFNSSSCLHLLCDIDERRIILPEHKIYDSSRVGLTLRRYDDNKEKYWLTEYRFLIFPHYHSKMKDFIVLSMIAKGESICTIFYKTEVTVQKFISLATNFIIGHSKKG